MNKPIMSGHLETKQNVEEEDCFISTLVKNMKEKNDKNCIRFNKIHREFSQYETTHAKNGHSIKPR